MTVLQMTKNGEHYRHFPLRRFLANRGTHLHIKRRDSSGRWHDGVEETGLFSRVRLDLEIVVGEMAGSRTCRQPRA